MAQKTNPIGLRLGLTQVWGTILQNYGNKNKFYSSFILKQFVLNNFLQKYIHTKTNYSLNKIVIELNCKSSKLKFSYAIKKNTLNTKLLNLYEQPLRQLCTSMHSCSNIEVFRELNSSITARLITSYVNYLFEQKLPLKLILASLENLLKDNLNLGKIIMLRNGVTKVVLKGFKLKISGRFDNTRNRMAKNYEQSYGSLSLAQLKSYVEFHSQTVFTKLGTCTIQVYLFYEIKDANKKKNS
uniref:Ribosomal protein S3 n=1 Tax=Gelidiella acerosa TaxID=28867 RepID=A0A7G9IVN5_9FLOR|nr:ribosomal protein S3 [Gelidiella acerosa]QNM39429.1 ribosomal protein S3 [Gelidiella acerosa]